MILRARRSISPLVVLVALLAVACSSGSDSSSDERKPSAPSTTDCDPARPSSSGTADHSFDHEGTAREYALTVPAGYDGETAAPLIVNLHGLSDTIDEQNALSNFPAAAGDRGYLVVTPQALDVALPIGDGGAPEATPFWNVAAATDQGESGLDAADDADFIKSLVTSIEEELCVDPERLYVSGLSNGAGMTMVLACDPESRFVAAAPVAGVNMTSSCPATGPVSAIAFHGDADDAVDYEGGNVAGFDLGNPGVEDRMAELATLGGCDESPTVEEPFDDIVVRTWENCADGTDVVLYTVRGGSHTWPGRTTYVDEQADLNGETTSIVATDQILDFFDVHPPTTN